MTASPSPADPSLPIPAYLPLHPLYPPTSLFNLPFIFGQSNVHTNTGNDFNDIEASLTSALSTMTTYYDKNQLRANPSKAQVCAFHLRNREAKRELNVVWNGARLSNTTTPMYLGVHLDWTMCYKHTCQSREKFSRDKRWPVERSEAGFGRGVRGSSPGNFQKPVLQMVQSELFLSYICQYN